jgi:hypothetical protein
MDKIYKIQTGQNIFDLSLQLFGSVENIYDIMVKNDLSSAATLPVEGSDLVYNAAGLGNELLKKEISTKRIEYANGQSSGSYNENFNPDFD